ncbi:MAG TPA: MarR family winged helix-turn-helix transcriptional regulator [Acidimicrobiales bacterium]|nr:MarR family winged helix-turn-helix transcriptional regulator [Acidimicrobiales bacterium]
MQGRAEQAGGGPAADDEWPGRGGRVRAGDGDPGLACEPGGSRGPAGSDGCRPDGSDGGGPGGSGGRRRAREPEDAGAGGPIHDGCCEPGDDRRTREPAPLSLRLSELGRAAGAGLRRHLAPLGLDARHYRVLAEVATLDGCSQRALTARLGIPPSRVVVILDGLEQRRLVERRERPGDRRSYALGLTPAGRDLLERARPLVEACDLALTGGLAEADRRDLDRLLRELAANCRSTAGPR